MTMATRLMTMSEKADEMLAAAEEVEPGKTLIYGHQETLESGAVVWVGAHDGGAAIRITDKHGQPLEFRLTPEATQALMDLLLIAGFNQYKGFGV
jgi:hypothetical protein